MISRAGWDGMIRVETLVMAGRGRGMGMVRVGVEGLRWGHWHQILLPCQSVGFLLLNLPVCQQARNLPSLRAQILLTWLCLFHHALALLLTTRLPLHPSCTGPPSDNSSTTAKWDHLNLNMRTSLRRRSDHQQVSEGVSLV